MISLLVLAAGFTINRVCHFTGKMLKKYSKYVPQKQKYITTMVGLGCIPFIVKPIDHTVDLLMDVSVRKMYVNDPSAGAKGDD